MTKRRVVTFHYTLKDKAGAVIDTSSGRDPVGFLEGAGSIIPGLEAVLLNFKVGEKRAVVVPAADGYGVRDEKLVLKLPRAKLPNTKLSIGNRLRGGNDPHAPIFTVTALTETEVTLDGNHPLAGQDLYFDIEVSEARDATLEEMNHSHAHCGCGHEHH